ncbi:DUF2254 domain-containing protein [Aliidiomarina minuta]|uniref:DUF2254 domain-containing protein n=1 Tax=Aliidiomarina minuta TaxID=880057 RepID=A0A432W1H7_9GAMM|nr:DUF2254 domain-containing protein [Aliidiomarina minuta]RUO22976.1 DUF2254 domain-containing protein [Aliidiomarina minuta]
MFSKWQWLLSHITSTLWVRACLFALVAVIAALLGILADDFEEISLPFDVGISTVDHILDILANSMLMITTFSLSVMVTAYVAATNNVTPRATTLIRKDSTTQNVLATFIGSFLFSLVGIIALNTEMYGHNGRLTLFAFTLAVIVLIIVTIFRWIEHLSLLGRVGETANQLEKTTAEALSHYFKSPTLGANPLYNLEHIPDSATPLYPQQVGYLQHLDMQMLEACAVAFDGEIYLAAVPGTLLHQRKAMAWYTGKPDDKQITGLREAFSIDHERSFDQDPRFGLCVLTEVAQRALSPAINDPGTAIDVISRHLRLLAPWKDSVAPEQQEIQYKHLFITPLDPNNLFDDAFLPIARDGGKMLEVHIRLHKALHALAEQGSEALTQAARECSLKAMEYAEACLTLETEKQVIRAYKM